jgi:cobaltochelatase CobT
VEPIAFLSYVRFEDEHEGGRLSQFRQRLSREVQVQTGEAFPIFQDRNDISWGQHWQTRINESLDAATFLIPIITPSFFRSAPCRDELARFLEREHQLNRQDLILPVYYVSTPQLDDPQVRNEDELAQVLFSRQYADWRELRFRPFTSPVVRRA